MEPERHGDPFSEALGRGAERAAQLGAVVGAAAQVTIMHKALELAGHAEEDRSAARFAAQQRRAGYEAARAVWAPARDRSWLANAGLLDVARAWGAAAPYADGGDPAAAAAVRACERRLRELHPYAMAYYDRRRADGADLVEAMTETVPLFARHPHARPGDPAPGHAMLTQAGPSAPGAAPEPGPPDPAAAGDGDDADASAVLARGRAITAELNRRADEQGRERLSGAELATALETLTNLPEDIIATLAAEQPGAAGLARTEERRAANAERDRAADLAGAADLAATPQDERTEGLDAAHRDGLDAASARARAAHYSVAQLNALEFPSTIEEVTAAAASRGAAKPVTGSARHPSRTRGAQPRG